MKSFYEKLAAAERLHNSLVCVGLDSELSKLPAQYNQEQYPQFTFNKMIIEATHDLVSSYKPNTAFYEAQGEQGILELKMTCDYIRVHYPDIVIIVDAKRADIGNTNNGYVSFVFDYLGADAVTLQPYLGQEAVQPFLDRKDKGSIILCRTSNPGSGELQELSIQGKPLYQHVASHVATAWNTNANCALVVGATYPAEMEAIRSIVPEMPLLIPGIGAQGGDVELTVKAGVDKNGHNAIINSARGIIFADDPRGAALALRDDINKYRGVAV